MLHRAFNAAIASRGRHNVSANSPSSSPSHRMNGLGCVRVAIGTKCGRTSRSHHARGARRNQICPDHPRRGLDAVIGHGAADHQRFDTGCAQPRFDIGADEGVVDTLDDDRLVLARFILHDKAGAAAQERRGRLGTLAFRRGLRTERGDEIGDPRHPLPIICAACLWLAIRRTRAAYRRG